jgi:hypothetical protein
LRQSSAAAEREAAVEATLLRELDPELGTKNVESRRARRSDVVVSIHAAIIARCTTAEAN